MNQRYPETGVKKTLSLMPAWHGAEPFVIEPEKNFGSSSTNAD